MAPNPHAFLLACVMPAMDSRERRLQVEGAICSELRNGVLAALRVIKDWHPQSKGVVIEPTLGFHATQRRTPPRAASFMSGGIDALATLRCNRLDFPLDHPASIRDCFFFLGFNRNDFDATGPVRDRLLDFQRRLDRMSVVAREARVNLIPLHTNIRFIARDHDAWSERGLGAGLASIAHIFARRITRVLIGSSDNNGTARSWGSHPLLDPKFSSADLEVRHDGLWLSRLQKTAIVADWDAAVAIVQCCWQNKLTDETINCGRCGKCLRTMIHLAALGKLRKTRAFPDVAVTPEMVYATRIAHEGEVSSFEECLDLFEKGGRTDLVQAIQQRVDEYRRYKHWIDARGWRGAIRRWDKKMMNDGLTNSARRVLRYLRRREKVPGVDVAP